MAFTYGFYNSINSDRRYDAVQLSSMFDGIVKDGVFESVGERFRTRSNIGMTIIVGSGRAWFNHTWSLNDTDVILTLNSSDILHDRIDTVVLEVDSSDEVRANKIFVITGIPSAIPEEPNLIRSDKKNQYPLCNVHIPAESIEISSENIINRVGTSDTPYTIPVSMVPRPFLIPKELWTPSSVYQDFVFQATIIVPGLNPDDLIRMDFDMKSFSPAFGYGIAASGDTSTDSATFYALSMPGVDLSGLYTIYRAKS